MPLGQVQAKLSKEDLLKAISQLEKSDLEIFVQQAIALRAQKYAPSLSSKESKLMQAINDSIPQKIQDRFDKLIVKRKAEKLTKDEYTELLHLTNQIEKFDTKRLKHLTQLAQLRRLPIKDLMKQIGIQPPAYA